MAGDGMLDPAQPRAGQQSCITPAWLQRYFSDPFTEVKVVLRLPPMPLTAAMITKAIPVAIRQYSMAVAPDWSRRNSEMSRRT
jgi:hypothetical protein